MSSISTRLSLPPWLESISPNFSGSGFRARASGFKRWVVSWKFRLKKTLLLGFRLIWVNSFQRMLLWNRSWNRTWTPHDWNLIYRDWWVYLSVEVKQKHTSIFFFFLAYRELEAFSKIYWHFLCFTAFRWPQKALQANSIGWWRLQTTVSFQNGSRHQNPGAEN